MSKSINLFQDVFFHSAADRYKSCAERSMLAEKSNLHASLRIGQTQFGGAQQTVLETVSIKTEGVWRVAKVGVQRACVSGWKIPTFIG